METTKQEITKKILEVKTIGDIEHTTKKIKIIVKEDWNKIFEFVNDIIDDDSDYEASYNKGIATDINDDLAYIGFDSLIEYVEDRQRDIEQEGENEETEYKNNKEILPILNRYKGYIY